MLLPPGGMSENGHGFCRGVNDYARLWDNRNQGPASLDVIGILVGPSDPRSVHLQSEGFRGWDMSFTHPAAT